MAKFGNRVKETTDTTGTGTLDLNGAATGFRGFSDEFTSGDDEISYLIVDDPDNPSEYEYGKGTFTTGTPNTLSRDTVEGSSNSGNKVSFSAGTKTVIATPTAKDMLALGVKGADIAAATTVDLDAATGDLVDITGTTTITAITLAEGAERTVRFTGALTLTHGASLVLLGGADITTAAGDFAVFRGYAAGVVRMVGYARANGKPVADVTSKAIMVFSVHTSISAGNTRFLGLGDATSTEAQVSLPVPFAGTINNLYCLSQAAAGAGESFIYTVHKNGSDTSVTATISGGSATAANDTSNTVSVVAGDRVTVKVVVSGGGAATAHMCSFFVE